MINTNDSNDSNDSNQADSIMQNKSSDTNFDSFLRDQLQQEKLYLHGESFAAQVMENLPTAKAKPTWQERLIVLVPLLVISILVLSQNSLLAFAIRSWVLLTVSSAEHLFTIALEISLLAVIGVACWFAKQFRLI